MKTALRIIVATLSYILFIPAILAATLCLTWYCLPEFGSTGLGMSIGNWIGQEHMLLTTILVGISTITFFILGKVFNPVKNSKVVNFYTHMITWLVAVVLACESIYTFIASDVVQTVSVSFSATRKCGILCCGIAMLLYSIIAPKVRKLVDRRIQAYDTAKELNAKGRSSVVGMQILKCFDFVCPELFLLLALCFAFNWEIALYFIYMIAAFVIPVCGNMICDARVKREATLREIKQQESQINATATAVIEKLEEKGELKHD